MPGPPPKPADQRARRNRDEGTTSTTVVLPAEATVEWVERWPVRTVEVDRGDGELVTIPAPQRRWLKAIKEQWSRFWLVPEARMVRLHHLPEVERLFQLYDEEERLRRRVGRRKNGVQVGHVTVGSQGQLVRAPEWDQLMQTRKEIRALEDRCGASPMAEFRVGWQQAAMHNEQTRAREASQLADAANRIASQHERMTEGSTTN